MVGGGWWVVVRAQSLGEGPMVTVSWEIGDWTTSPLEEYPSGGI